MKLIEVQPNPYIALDKDGIPQGTVCVPGYPTSHIGALVDPVATRKAGKERFYFPLSREGKATLQVPFSAEIATAVRAGELLAANLDDARICGISEKEFKDPQRALDDERAKAEAYYQSVRGKNAQVQDIPRKPTEEPDAAAEKTSANSKKGALRQLTSTVALAGTAGQEG